VTNTVGSAGSPSSSLSRNEYGMVTARVGGLVQQEPHSQRDECEPRNLGSYELDREQLAGAGVTSERSFRLVDVRPLALAAAISLGVWMLVAWFVSNML